MIYLDTILEENGSMQFTVSSNQYLHSYVSDPSFGDQYLMRIVGYKCVQSEMNYS